MNRQIKFRVWDTCHKQWIGACAIESDGTIIDIHNAMPETNCIAQQYTGLNDKNGKEIYEGDIVKDTWKENRPYSYSPDEEYDCEKIFEVKYEDYSFNLDRKYSREQTCVDDFHREVIGNIFEHKHLLEK